MARTTEQIEADLKVARRMVAELEHELWMLDPDYAASFEKYGDPVTVGKTLARQVMLRMLLRSFTNAKKGRHD